VIGIRAYRSISDLPDGKIDLAILLVNSSIVLETLEKLSKKGITNVLLVSSGFAETGKKGSACRIGSDSAVHSTA